MGLAPADPATFGWKDRLADWLRANSFLSTTTRAAVKGKVTLEGKPMRWGMVAFVPATGHQPLAWAMVSNGQFSLAANRGPVVGANRVLVYDLGAVEPRPTREDFAVIDKQLSAEIKDGMNELQFEIGK